MIQTPASHLTSAFALNNATDEDLALTDATQLRQFILDACLSSNPVSGVTTPSVNLFPSFFPFPTSSKPKMDRVHQSIASIEVATYLGSFDFLDGQASFDFIFGPNQVMLRISKRAAGTCDIEEIEYLATWLAKYCNLCQLHLFCSIIELQFIGTKTYNTYRMMHDIYLTLSELKVVFRTHGILVTLAPDALYQ